MVRIIETNLSMKDYKIMDHQSLMIEVDSWDKYIEYYKSHYIEDWYNYDEIIEYIGDEINFTSLTNLTGSTLLPKNILLIDLQYDDFHMTCDFVNKYGFLTKKLAYLAD